jgi:hypothetical protein
MSKPMTIQGIYACMAVSDFAAGVDYYTRLMGREPDDRPMPNMVQWRKGGGLQIWHDPDHAGHSRITIVVPVMAEERQRLEAAGLDLGPDFAGDWGIVAQLADPDGNAITLAEPPKGFVS